MLNSNMLQVTLFEGLPSEAAVELDAILEECRFLTGEVILHQNQAAEHLFIIAKGEVVVRHVPYDGHSISIGKLSSGGIFGWSAILGRDVYSSTVVVLRDCVVYRISSNDLQRFCDHHHESGVVLLEKMAMSAVKAPTEIHEQVKQMIRRTMDCREEKPKRSDHDGKQ